VNDWRYNPAQDLGLQPNQRHCSPLRESDLTSSVLRFGWLMTVRTILKCWNRLEIHGLENLPDQPPFVIVANHSSHLDTVVLASALSLRWRDHVSPLAAGDYFFATPPLAGLSAVILNALPIWRDRRHGQRHELGDLRERLVNQSAVYIVFPEGSRSRDGQLHEFKPGFATLVAGTDIPVLPCHLSGSFAAMPPDASAVRPRKIILQIGTPLTFETVANHAEGWRRIAAVTKDKIVALSACELPSRKYRTRHRGGKLVLTARFARLLLRRRLRSLAGIGGAVR
jgi:1-acyl-sn-glycerol-3-phosphate acyltransferase